jgi:hypothetical protein
MNTTVSIPEWKFFSYSPITHMKQVEIQILPHLNLPALNRQILVIPTSLSLCKRNTCQGAGRFFLYKVANTGFSIFILEIQMLTLFKILLLYKIESNTKWINSKILFLIISLFKVSLKEVTLAYFKQNQLIHI